MEPQKLMTHRKRKASKQFKSHFNAAIFKIPKIRKLPLQRNRHPPEMVTHEQESIETRAVAALRRQCEKKAEKARRRLKGATFFSGAFLIFWKKYTL